MRFRSLSFSLALAAAALAGACTDVPSASLQADATARLSAGVPASGRYIVVFRDDVGDPAGLAARLVAAGGGELHHTYRYALKGFAATLPAAAVEGLRHNPHVASIEPDQPATPLAVQTPSPWALDRSDQRTLPRNDTFIYNYNGAGVRIYIIDSGIDVTHPEFGGRATLGYDACFRGCFAGDGFGHGTQVAGVAGSATYGVAKGVSLISVRVYSNRYSPTGQAYDTVATAATIAQGVDWVTQQKQLNPSIPMIANISSGLAPSPALDQSVRNSIAAGVTYTIGAGNTPGDACNFSPARVTEALTVGGSTKADYMWSGSSSGPCVDLYAPGSLLSTTLVGGGIANNNISGTSVAAPHVAGFAAQYLQAYPASGAASVHSAVIYYSTKNVLMGLGTGSYNRLLYTNWVAGQSGRPPGCCL
jgi:subtilisin family serine protease